MKHQLHQKEISARRKRQVPLQSYVHIFNPDLHCASLQVLVLGAGYVSAPVVEYLTRDPSIGVTVAADLSEAAKSVASKYEKQSLI